MIRWFEQRQVYAPTHEIEARVESLGRPYQEVWLTTPDAVRLHALFFPAEPDAPRKHLALLVCHGNAGNLSTRLKYFQAWLELGLNVLAFDYRGYGRSEGIPSEEGTYLDAQTAVAWLKEQQGQRQGFPPDRILLLGKSLGGGIASELALREPVGALILQSTFTSIPDLGCELFPWLPVRRWHRIHYDTLQKLPRIHTPVLVAHSTEDDLIGFHHAERNFAAANSPKMFLRIKGTHNSVLEDGRQAYLEGLNLFLKEHGA